MVFRPLRGLKKTKSRPQENWAFDVQQVLIDERPLLTAHGRPSFPGSGTDISNVSHNFEFPVIPVMRISHRISHRISYIVYRDAYIAIIARK